MVDSATFAVEENLMSRRNILLLAICAFLLLLVYTVDLFKLNYRLTGWKEFGNTPFVVSHIQYFDADTPNIISYLDRTLGKEVTCHEAIAFVETDAQETQRCCNADGTVSCLQGDFSSDIPSADGHVSLNCWIFSASLTRSQAQRSISSTEVVPAAGSRN
jgi:hypothetical protein